MFGPVEDAHTLSEALLIVQISSLVNYLFAIASVKKKKSNANNIKL